MQADLKLKERQSIWENPRNIAVLVGTTATITAAVAGGLGYTWKSEPPRPITINLVLPNGTVISAQIAP